MSLAGAYVEPNDTISTPVTLFNIRPLPHAATAVKIVRSAGLDE